MLKMGPVSPDVAVIKQVGREHEAGKPVNAPSVPINELYAAAASP
jgi:hypothetical protein